MWRLHCQDSAQNWTRRTWIWIEGLPPEFVTHEDALYVRVGIQFLDPFVVVNDKMQGEAFYVEAKNVARF